MIRADNFEVIPAKDEIELVIEFLLVSTNIDYATHYQGELELKDHEIVKNLCYVLSVLKKHLPQSTGPQEVGLIEKVNAIMSMYLGAVVV